MKSFGSIVKAHPFVSEAAWQHSSRELLQQQVQSQDGQQTPGAKHLSRTKHTKSHLWLTVKKQQHKHNSDCAHLESSGFSGQSWTSRLSVAALRPLSRWPVCRVFVAMHLGWVYIMGLAPGGLFRLSVCVRQLDLPPLCHHYFPTSEAAVRRSEVLTTCLDTRTYMMHIHNNNNSNNALFHFPRSRMRRDGSRIRPLLRMLTRYTPGLTAARVHIPV